MFEETEFKIFTVFCIICCILRVIFMLLWRREKVMLFKLFSTCAAKSKIAAVVLILNWNICN